MQLSHSDGKVPDIAVNTVHPGSTSILIANMTSDRELVVNGISSDTSFGL